MIQALLRATTIFIKDATCPQDKSNGVSMTRALQKLIKFKNASAMAVSFLENEICELCDGNILREDFNKNHCKNCHSSMRIFSQLAQMNLSFFFKQKITISLSVYQYEMYPTLFSATEKPLIFEEEKKL